MLAWGKSASMLACGKYALCWHVENTASMLACGKSALMLIMGKLCLDADMGKENSALMLIWGKLCLDVGLGKTLP